MKIFGFAGKKQSGKGTCANVIHGMVLKKMQLITDYKISDKGELLIKSPNAAGGRDWVIFDITRTDDEFAEYAESTFWPFVKVYSFADMLKKIAVNLFRIPAESVYGTNEQKNKPIEHLRWENMPSVVTTDTLLALQGYETSGGFGINGDFDTDPENDLKSKEGFDSDWCGWADEMLEEHPEALNGKLWMEKYVIHTPGPMTGREFMQFFGTEVMRGIWNPVWVHTTINTILAEDTEIAIIADVRFPLEVEAIKAVPGNVLKLTRNVFDDGHSSETAVDEIPDSEYTRIIDNSKGTPQDLQKEIEMLFTPIVNELPIVEG